jgi:ribosomal protein L32
MSEENGEYGVKKIKVNIDRSPEVEAIRAEKEAVEQELENKKAVLAQQALEAFEAHKQKLAKQFNDDGLLECTSPSELYNRIAAYSEKEETKPSPKGKAPWIGNSGATGHKSQAELLDELYDKAYINSSKYTPEEVASAKQKIKTLWESLLTGRSWSQLKENPRAIQQHKLSSCPNCGFTLVDRTDCPNCGYDPTERQKVVKTRVFKGPDSKEF